jgi:hypothetical protein
MKRFGVGLLALVFTVAAYAAKNSQTVDLGQTVQVGSTKLPAGPVKVSWTGTGANAQVTLTAKGQNPVTVPAKIVDERHAYPGVETINISGVQYLQGFELGNVTVEIQSPAPAAANAGN